MATKKNKESLDLHLGPEGLQYYRELSDMAQGNPHLLRLSQNIASAWQKLTELDKMMLEAEEEEEGNSLVSESKRGAGRMPAMLQSWREVNGVYTALLSRWAPLLKSSGGAKVEEPKKIESKLAALMPVRKTAEAKATP